MNGCLPLTWHAFKTTLPGAWMRTDVMDLMVQHLKPYLPDSVLMLNSAFGNAIVRLAAPQLSRWRLLRERRTKHSPPLRCVCWPYLRNSHWVAVFVDLGAPGDKECFHVYDSLSVKKRRTEGKKMCPTPLTQEFSLIFAAFGQLLEHDRQVYGNASIWGCTNPLGAWEARMMDAGEEPGCK